MCYTQFLWKIINFFVLPDKIQIIINVRNRSSWLVKDIFRICISLGCPDTHYMLILLTLHYTGYFVMRWTRVFKPIPRQFSKDREDIYVTKSRLRLYQTKPSWQSYNASKLVGLRFWLRHFKVKTTFYFFGSNWL